MRDGDYVWEKWMVDDYTRLMPENTCSPYHGGPMQVSPHLFAASMIELLADLSKLNTTTAIVATNINALSPLGRGDEVATIDPALDRSRFILYIYFARMAKRREGYYWARKEANKETLRISQLTEQSIKQSEQVFLQSKKATEDHSATIAQHLAQIQETHQKTQEVLNNNINDTQRRNDYMTAAIALSDAEIQRQAKEILQLKAQLK